MIDGLENFISFDQAPTEAAVEYAFHLGEGIRGLRFVANTLELLDVAGYPRLRVAPPSIVGADGESHAARMTVLDCAFDASPRIPWGREVTPPGRSDCRLRIEWGSADVKYPALLDPSWTTTGSMAQARNSHTATLLPSGDVLVAGGFGLASAEIYNRGTGVWTATGNMTQSRYAHSANSLQNGDVLVLGGYSTNGASSETYSVATGTWTAAGDMPSARSAHASIELPDGRVLATGGINAPNNYSYDALTAIFDPTARTWSAGPPMASARALHELTRLADGRVLAVGGSVSGGVALTSCELYNPTTSTWSATGSMTTARYNHAVALMHTGSVLAAGGYGGGQFLAAAETYNPATGTWTNRAAMSQARSGATATRGPNGAIHVIGGYAASTFFASTELFSPTALTWSTGSPLANRRGDHVTVPFEGVFLVVGGRQENNTPLTSAELLDLRSSPSAPGHNFPPWTSSDPPTSHPPRTRLLNNPPSFLYDPCLPTHSCPTVDVGPFLDWGSEAYIEEDEVIRTILTRERNNQTICDQFCAKAGSIQPGNWDRRLMALTFLGSMRSPYAESCLTQFANQPLPTTGTFVEHTLLPSDSPVEASALAILETVAVDGLALLVQSATAKAEVRRIAKDHPSPIVRSEAIRAYIANYGATGRQELTTLVRTEELWMLDRFENRAPNFDANLATFLTQHPEAIPPTTP